MSPDPNVWLGTSVEDEQVTGRIDELRAVPAVIRFISFEPLIGSVGSVDLSDIHWAIVGGESGRLARPIREEWIDEIHAQCERRCHINSWSMMYGVKGADAQTFLHL